jgi:hypothetical protein
MRHVVWFLDVVELATFDRLPVFSGCWTPPVDLVGTRCAEDLHPRRSIRKITTELFVDVEIPGRVGVEAGEDSLLVAACLSGFVEFDLRVTVLAEHPLEGNVAEHLVSTNGTPEELEQCFTVAVNDFQTHL